MRRFLKVVPVLALLALIAMAQAGIGTSPS